MSIISILIYCIFVVLRGCMIRCLGALWVSNESRCCGWGCSSVKQDELSRRVDVILNYTELAIIRHGKAVIFVIMPLNAWSVSRLESVARRLQ
jgi:hypothetical protein